MWVRVRGTNNPLSFWDFLFSLSGLFKCNDITFSSKVKCCATLNISSYDADFTPVINIPNAAAPPKFTSEPKRNN